MRKKILYPLILLTIALMFCIFLNHTVFAQNKYPLENNEKIIEQVLDGDRAQLITCIDDQYYIKELIYEQDSWIVSSIKEIEPRKTGLEINESELEKDKTLEPLIKNELKAQGFSYNLLPKILDYSTYSYLPPVGEQYENSCVGWAAGYYLRTFQQARDVGWSVGNNEEHIFSPLFIYNQINNGVDRGSYIEEAGELIRNMGAATLSNFPYIPRDYMTQPTAEVKESAFPHRIREWRILYTQYDSVNYIVQRTKEYLNTGDLVAVGADIGFKFQYPYKDNNGNSIITSELYPAYRHAYVIVGYDDTLPTPEGYGAFKLINSWGTGWGNQGFSYITYNAYAEGAIAGFVFTDLVNQEMEGDIEKVDTEIISPTEIKYTWNEPLNAEGYRILDSNNRVIKEIYDRNSYAEYLTTPGYIIRDIQAFDLKSSGNPVRVSLDTRDFKQQELPLTLNDSVIFNINFKGTGRYGIKINDNKNNLVYEELNIQGINGENELTWNGRNSFGDNVPNGTYKLNIITYKNGTPSSSYPYSFQKHSKVKDVSAIAYVANNEIQRIELSITAKMDCMLDIKIINGNNTDICVAENEPLYYGETRLYTIGKIQYDLSNIIIDTSSIIIDVR